MLLPKRHGSVDSYRYGFQGQEKDDEIKGEGNSINFKYRIHDPRVGRFFAVDPLTKEYPHYTPYSFSGNKVIHAVELEGLEEWILNSDKPSFKIYHKFLHVVQHDDVLNNTLVRSLNKPELEENHKIYFGVFNFGNEGPNGKTYDNSRLRGYVYAAYLNNLNPDLYEGDALANTKRTIKVLEAIGITSDDYKKILNDKNTKRTAVVIDSEKQTEIDQIKTIAHELDFHVKNAINYDVTGDEKYNKSPAEEHIDAHGKDYYERTGTDPERSSPPKNKIPKNSRADKLYKKIDEAYVKEKKKKS